MTSAAAELQKALRDLLLGDGELTGLLGGERVHDHVPANRSFPYVTFGNTVVRDWSTSTEAGHEIRMELHVWSRAKGKLETLQIVEAVRDRLETATPQLAGHELVSLRIQSTDIVHDDDLALYHGAMRLRARVEPAG